MADGIFVQLRGSRGVPIPSNNTTTTEFVGEADELLAELQNRHPALGFFFVRLGSLTSRLVHRERKLEARLLTLVAKPFLFFSLPDLLDDEPGSMTWSSNSRRRVPTKNAPTSASRSASIATPVAQLQDLVSGESNERFGYPRRSPTRG